MRRTHLRHKLLLNLLHQLHILRRKDRAEHLEASTEGQRANFREGKRGQERVREEEGRGRGRGSGKRKGVREEELP